MLILKNAQILISGPTVEFLLSRADKAHLFICLYVKGCHPLHIRVTPPVFDMTVLLCETVYFNPDYY